MVLIAYLFKHQIENSNLILTQLLINKRRQFTLAIGQCITYKNHLICTLLA